MLSIYNTSGQRLHRLVEGMLSQGRHEVFWNGRDEAGRVVAAGVYIYRLEVGAFVQQRKMLRLDGGGMGGGAGHKVLVQSTAFAVELRGEHILDRGEQVVVTGDEVVDFAVDERFLWTLKAPMPTLRQEITAAALTRLWPFAEISLRGKGDPERELGGVMSKHRDHLILSRCLSKGSAHGAHSSVSACQNGQSRV